MSLESDVLSNLIELAPDAMLVVDDQGIIVYANRKASAVFGCRREDILHQRVEYLLPERFRARHSDHRRRFAADGRMRPMGAGLDLYARRWDGVEFPVEISLSPLQDDPGGYTAAAIRDATDRKRVERELIAAREAADLARETADAAREAADRANHGKSRFLATASHDLRQPLQSLALLNGALRRMALDERAAQTLAQQEQAIDAMKRLLNALLDVSKLESGAVKPQVADFALATLFEALRNEFASAASAKGVELQVEQTTQCAYSDPALVEQILRNLLSNAVKYTHRGAVRLRCAQSHGLLRIEVVDTGVGIATDQRALIFDEFFQVDVAPNTTRDGYGLGLAIVQRLVKLLGLRLEVQSEPGEGSIFALELPAGLSAAAGAAGGGTEPAPPRVYRLARVLLVEDHPGVLQATKLLLTLENYRVVAAASRAEALQRAREDRNFDLLITDYHLGGGETGLELIGALRTILGRETPVVLVTGDTSSAVRELPQDALLRVASKPVNADELLALIRELLDSGVELKPVPGL